MVRGKHNALVHFVDVCAPNPSGVVVLCTPFKWDVLCSFLIKKHMAQNSYIAIKALMHHQYYGLSTPKKRYGAHHNTPTRYRAALKINYWMEKYLLLTWLPMGRKIIGQNSIHHTTSLFNSFSSYKEYFTFNLRLSKISVSHYTGHITDYPVTNHLEANMVYLLWRVYLLKCIC